MLVDSFGRRAYHLPRLTAGWALFVLLRELSYAGRAAQTFLYPV